ncbi:aldehyde oxidase 3-like [Protopterus annectens]|uniref:aldehyde oxidase 3-like n=1 Tax=Protopterus annectens TaxID=7888 RepID=UPI001CF97CCE|nr:aldehyde oxidase 3-like [Protopterus annectens]
MSLDNRADELIFFVNGRKVIEKNADPEQTLLFYLRKKLYLTGTKYGCGGGGCGACTVMISRYDHLTQKIQHFSAVSCLVPVCMLHGMAVTTVEGVGSTKSQIHPVQERIAKAHGSQCGFCTPGMVMSMYTLLRNNPEPSTEELLEALSGNLCRCTGYRPIIAGYKTFCKDSCCLKKDGDCCMNKGNNSSLSSDQIIEGTCTELFKANEFMPLDSTQELIFPPELILMAQQQEKRKMFFSGERITWISPVHLKELLELKANYPKAPLVTGNTNVGPDMKFKGVFHPVIISPTRVQALNSISQTEKGMSFGSACTLSFVKDILQEALLKIPRQEAKAFQVLFQQLKSLGGKQIRNMASLGGNIISASPTSDLNPILAASKCNLNVSSKDGTRQIPLNEDFFLGYGKTSMKPNEVLVSIDVPNSEKWEFISAFRQAPRQDNAFAVVNAGMRVVFKEESNIISQCNIFYGGTGPTTVGARKTCQQLIGRTWDEDMLSTACRLILDEISLPATAPGGMVEFRRTLIISFFFKFYLQVLQELKQMGVPDDKIPQNYLSATEDFPQGSIESKQIFQDISWNQSAQDLLGHPLMHQSAIKQATGEAMYCDDIRSMDGELHLVMVTSTRPHASIVSIDKMEALKMPGVVTIVTADDVPGSNVMPYLQDETVFAENKVTCVGEIICAVVAETVTQAKRAARAVKITYHDLKPVIITPEDAIEKQSFYSARRKLERGNVDEAFKTADHVFEGHMHVGGQEHFYLETQSVIVIPKGEDKEMDVYVTSQHPRFAQESVALVMGTHCNKIMCHVKRVGGAFGGKIIKPGKLASITAVAAYKTGRPVRCVLERGDDMLITGGRQPFLGKYKVGFMNDGRIISADVIYYSNAGNTLDESDLVIEKAILQADNAYSIPNFRCAGFVCKTNLPSNTAFRGFGVPEGLLITEYLVNEVAMRSGIPPEKIREMNMYKEKHIKLFKQEYNPNLLLRSWEECLEKSSFYQQKAAIAEFNNQNRWRKRGIAIIPLSYGVGFPYGFLNQAAALIHIYKDGSVLVTHGGIEMGQGIHTKMMQIVSRELKIPLSYIHISDTSTKTVPNTIESAASFATDVNGMAVKAACRTLKERLDPIISENPKKSWEEWVDEAFMKRISLSATGYFRGWNTYMDWEKSEGFPYTYYMHGACCSVVEIDCLTGGHRNLRTDIIIDAGIPLNPAVDIGQIEGAFTQGVGLYTMEELKYSPEGVLFTRGPAQYKIPAPSDVPQKFNVYLLSGSKNPKALYSSKGLGEPVLFLGCSVFYAIMDAIAAARKDSGITGHFTLYSPATCERIRMACVDQFTQQIPRDKPDSYVPWSVLV